MNYFEMFQVPPSFHLDEKDLRNTFYRLSRLYHPDLQENESDKQNALVKSGELNQAYKTLSTLELRVPYYLELLGQFNPEGKHTLTPGFLMEMMDYNDRIQEAESPEAKAALQSEIEGLFSDNRNELAAACLQFDEKKEASLLPNIREIYHQGKYISRLLKQLGGEETL